MAALSLDRRLHKIRNRLKHHPGSQSLRDRLKALQKQRTPKPQPKPPGKPGRPPSGQSKQAATPIPYSTGSDTSIADARTTYEQDIAGLAGQEIQTQQAYGIAAPYNNPATNPYSAAALLQANYDRVQQGSVTSYAAGGQLYAGSLQNARNYNRGNYGIAYDKMLGKYQGALADIANKRVSAGVDLQRAKQDAYASALEDALNTTPDPTEYPPNLPKPGGRGGNGTGGGGGHGTGGGQGGGGKGGSGKGGKGHKKKPGHKKHGGGAKGTNATPDGQGNHGSHRKHVHRQGQHNRNRQRPNRRRHQNR